MFALREGEKLESIWEEEEVATSLSSYTEEIQNCFIFLYFFLFWFDLDFDLKLDIYIYLHCTVQRGGCCHLLLLSHICTFSVCISILNSRIFVYFQNLILLWICLYFILESACIWSWNSFVKIFDYLVFVLIFEELVFVLVFENLLFMLVSENLVFVLIFDNLVFVLIF